MSRESCPMDAVDVLSEGFLEHRAHLVELAAFLDRIDRARHPAPALADARYRALRSALELLLGTPAERAKTVLLSWSDPTIEPLEGPAASKSAEGVWRGSAR